MKWGFKEKIQGTEVIHAFMHGHVLNWFYYHCSKSVSITLYLRLYSVNKSLSGSFAFFFCGKNIVMLKQWVSLVSVSECVSVYPRQMHSGQITDKPPLEPM